MALRVSKAVLVFAIAFFYTILVLNNITDYRSNYEFVRHVLMMDTTFPGNHGMWRAVNSPLVHTVFYIGIIAWESITMLLCWWGGARLLKSYRADSVQFAAARNVAVIALTTSLLMWLVAFLDVGGEWFLMWQSQLWNGQEAAFRMFTIVGVVLLVVAATRANSRLVGSPGKLRLEAAFTDGALTMSRDWTLQKTDRVHAGVPRCLRKLLFRGD